MSDAPRYLLDTNVFIEAKKRYYAFDLCPGFWESLLSQHQAGRIRSIDRVREEIARVEDQLTQWAASVMPAEHFAASDEDDTVAWFAKMMAWVQASEQFSANAKARFASDADGWLIAYAKARGMVLVTHEAFNPVINKKVPMPNVCREFGVRTVNTFEMLRALKIQFIQAAATR